MRFDLQSELPGDYADLFARSGATAFQHPLWVAAFTRHLVPGREAKAVFVTARDGDRLIGLVALTTRRANGLRLLEPFDLGVCDYVAPIADESCDCATIARRMKGHLPPHDLLRVSNVRPEHVEFWSQLSGDAHEPAGFSAHAVRLSGDFSQWRAASIDRSLASQTKRKAKRLHRDADVRFERVAADEAGRAVGTLADLRAGRFDGDPIQQPATRAFYAEVAERGADGFSETWRLSADGETAGLLFGVTHGGTFHYLLIGCDYDRFGRHSPGQLLYEHVIEDWMARGGTRFDFTIGDEPFKRQYGTTATPMARLCTARTIPGRLGRFVLERRKAAA